jgi:hypothetical protein
MALGSIFSTSILNKVGEVRCISVGSLFNAPWILSFALAGMKGEYAEGEPQPVYLNSGFVSFVIMSLSILNGVGQTIQWVG